MLISKYVKNSHETIPENIWTKNERHWGNEVETGEEAEFTKRKE